MKVLNYERNESYENYEFQESLRVHHVIAFLHSSRHHFFIVQHLYLSMENSNQPISINNHINPQYPLSDLTGKIIGCAIEVHRLLGNGFQEIIYQRALAIEMSSQGIDFFREQEMEILYKGENIGTRRVDFFVEGKVMVELKATVQLEDVHLAQAINYLEAYGLEIGLLINFGNKKIQFKRVMKPKKNT